GEVAGDDVPVDGLRHEQRPGQCEQRAHHDQQEHAHQMKRVRLQISQKLPQCLALITGALNGYAPATMSHSHIPYSCLSTCPCRLLSDTATSITLSSRSCE